MGKFLSNRCDSLITQFSFICLDFTRREQQQQQQQNKDKYIYLKNTFTCPPKYITNVLTMPNIILIPNQKYLNK